MPSGANTSPPAPVPPPPPSPYEINRAFRFNAAVIYPPAGDFLARAASIGDVTGDGRPDVVVATESSRPEDRSRIFIRSCQGTALSTSLPYVRTGSA